MDDGKKRLLQAVRELSLAFALAVPDERALAIRDDVSFFQAVRAALVKSTVDGERDAQDLTRQSDKSYRVPLPPVIKSLISLLPLVEETRNLHSLPKNFSQMSKACHKETLPLNCSANCSTTNLKSGMKKNLVQSRSFTELLERTIRSYQNRTLRSAEVIAELIKLSEEIREAQKRGEKLNITEEEIAFYDALEVNDSAVQGLRRRCPQSHCP